MAVFCGIFLPMYYDEHIISVSSSDKTRICQEENRQHNGHKHKQRSTKILPRKIKIEQHESH